MVKIPYTIPSPGVYKPWVPVRLGNTKSHKVMPVPVNALIDSGADVCFAASYLADWLKIQLDKKNVREFTAANNKRFEACKASVKIFVAGKNYVCSFYFADSLPPQTPLILGQHGFFDNNIVKFDLRNREIEI